jgi:predicted MPP superfamily phosphohydrolase
MIVVFLVCLAGFINARMPRIKQLDLTIHKTVPGDPHLRIVMVSDIHLGTLIAKRRADYLTEKINSLHPDIILLAGDVVDEDLKPVIRRNLGENLRNLKSKLGVYAIPGNHEYIGGAPEAIKYLRDHAIIVLQDSTVFIDHRFYLAGRDDRDKPRFTGKPRKPIKEVMQDVDKNYPVIMMDHQPFRFDDVVAQGVDLQLSGHTHHGQLWPLNYITNAMYEVSWGYKLKGNTHFYVSSGFGSWGPPVRLGNRPEIVLINLTFKK